MLRNTVIDLSHHNKISSFQEILDNDIAAIFHKATQGKTVVDAKYDGRKKRAKDLGIL